MPATAQRGKAHLLDRWIEVDWIRLRASNSSYGQPERALGKRYVEVDLRLPAMRTKLGANPPLRRHPYRHLLVLTRPGRTAFDGERRDRTEVVLRMVLLRVTRVQRNHS